MNLERFEKEDIFEFIASVLAHAGIKLTREQMKKLAKELEVELRKRPLTADELFDDMFKKIKELEEDMK